MTDQRMAHAEQILTEGCNDLDEVLLVLGMIHGYALERLRVNVGLINENAALKKFDPIKVLKDAQEEAATGSRDFGRGYAQAITVLDKARKSQ